MSRRHWSLAEFCVQIRNLGCELFHRKSVLYVDGSHYWNAVRRDYSNHNLGDDLTFPLLAWLTGREVIPIRYTLGPRWGRRLLCIGSILEAHAHPHAVVWGAGLIQPPRKRLAFGCVSAVRGPETRRELLQQGIDCPPVYGDPAVLLPRIYTPKQIEKQHKAALIPHLMDRSHPFVLEWKKRGGICLALDHYGNWRDFVDQLCQCEAVLSSSLHGLILADAYGIPSRRIRLTDVVIGGDFKYRDYYGSFREGDVPDCLSGENMLDQEAYLSLIHQSWFPHPVDLGERLLQAFPWKELNIFPDTAR